VVGHSEHALGTYQQFQIHNFPDAILYQNVSNPDNRMVDWKQLENLLSQYAPKSKSDTGKPRPAAPHATIKPLSEKEKKAAMEQARELIENGEVDKALDNLLTLEKNDRENPEICTLLGKTYADMGDWQNAETWCKKAIQYNMLMRDAHYILALVYQHQARIQQAINSMKKVVYIDSNYALGYVGLADLYRSDNQMPQALKALDNARKLLSSGHPDDIVPGSGDITKHVLLSLVVRRQQQWSAESLLV
jgi:chemotaxis protein methyltransferase CheR